MCTYPMPEVRLANCNQTLEADKDFNDWQPFDNALYDNHVVLITSVRGEKCSVSWMENDGTHADDVDTKELDAIPINANVVLLCKPTVANTGFSAEFSFKNAPANFILYWDAKVCIAQLNGTRIGVKHVFALHQFQNLVREYSHGGIIFYNMKNGLDNVCLGVNDAN